MAEHRIVNLDGEDVDVTIWMGALPASGLIAIKLSQIRLWPCATPTRLAEKDAIQKSYGLINHTSLGWTDHPSNCRSRDSSERTHRVPHASRSVIAESAVLHVVLQGGGGGGRLPASLDRNLIEHRLLI